MLSGAVHQPAQAASSASGEVAADVWSGRTLQRFGLPLILMLFLLQAAPFLSRRWVTDESWYAGPAYSVAHGHGLRDPAIGPNDLENQFDARPPGTALTIAGCFRLFGSGAWQARLASLLAGLGATVLLFRLTRRMAGDEAALLAALVLATDNLLVLCSRTARPEALTVFCVLLGLTALERHARSNSSLWAVAAGLSMALTTMFHITALGYIVAVGLLLAALDLRRRRFTLPDVWAYAAAFTAGLIPYAIWILTAPLGRQGFQQEFLGRAVQTSLAGRFFSEGRRYTDVLGLGMVHGHGLETLPVRLPIPLVFLAATALLWRYRRNWFYLEMVLLLPSVLWLGYTVNKSSRYVALLAPVFAFVIGTAASAVRGNRLMHRVALALVGLVAVAQAGANFMLLHAASQADYTRVGAGLRSLIPADQTAYGSMTFWLAFRGRPFISYERTQPWMAARSFGVRYYILGDRVMINGQVGDENFYKELNEDLAQITAQSEEVGQVNDPYYGHLTVYKLPDKLSPDAAARTLPQLPTMRTP